MLFGKTWELKPILQQAPHGYIHI